MCGTCSGLVQPKVCCHLLVAYSSHYRGSAAPALALRRCLEADASGAVFAATALSGAPPPASPANLSAAGPQRAVPRNPFLDPACWARAPRRRGTHLLGLLARQPPAGGPRICLDAGGAHRLRQNPPETDRLGLTRRWSRISRRAVAELGRQQGGALRDRPCGGAAWSSNSLGQFPKVLQRSNLLPR